MGERGGLASVPGRSALRRLGGEGRFQQIKRLRQRKSIFAERVIGCPESAFPFVRRTDKDHEGTLRVTTRI